MAETSEPTCGKTRLFGVDFPWMQVENGRLSILVQPAYAPSRPRVREDSEIAPATNRQVERSDTHRRPRDFHQASCAALDAERFTRRHGDPVSIVADRKDAGVVRVTFFDQNVERPQ